MCEIRLPVGKRRNNRGQMDHRIRVAHRLRNARIVGDLSREMAQAVVRRSQEPPADTPLRPEPVKSRHAVASSEKLRHDSSANRAERPSYD